MKGVHIDRTAVLTSPLGHRLDAKLHEILLDVTALCRLFKDDQNPGSVDLVTFQEIIISICYRLLRFRSLNESRRMLDQHSAIHVGLMIFIMTIFIHHGRRKMITFEVVVDILLDISSEPADGQNDYVLFWLLMIGGIWASDDAWGNQIVPRLKETAKRMGIGSWDDARTAIQKMPWIPPVHDRPGETLWTKLAVNTH